MKVDIGSYNSDPQRYQQLVDELYSENPSITLPPEYASFVKNNLLRLLIRLARYKFVARLIKKGDRVLEVGCGSGLGSIFLSQHCAHVTGLDVKTTEIEEANSINRRENVEFKVGDLFEIEASQVYDVIVNLDVIEHMPVEQGHQLVAAMARRLEPTGMLIIGTPSIYSYEYQSPMSQASHVKCYDQEELLALVDNYFGRTLAFSMNDEVVHTGFSKMAWYYFVLAFMPKDDRPAATN
jgi:2-polyprenyl-3-methyl-5-hydroxy-6-metoxy-1,4-benzoquinol methylase